MSRPPDTAQAEHHVALIRDLKENEGFREWLLPRLESVRANLEQRIQSGGCSSFDDYQACVRLRDELEGSIFRPLATDLSRHLQTLATNPRKP